MYVYICRSSLVDRQDHRRSWQICEAMTILTKMCDNLPKYLVYDRIAAACYNLDKNVWLHNFDQNMAQWFCHKQISWQKCVIYTFFTENWARDLNKKHDLDTNVSELMWWCAYFSRKEERKMERDFLKAKPVDDIHKVYMYACRFLQLPICVCQSTMCVCVCVCVCVCQR